MHQRTGQGVTSKMHLTSVFRSDPGRLSAGRSAMVLLGVAFILLHGDRPVRADEAAARNEAARKSEAAGNVVETLLTQYCVQCHGPNVSEHDLRLDQLAWDAEDVQERDRWRAVVDQLELGTMPPEGEPRPGRQVIEEVVTSIRHQIGSTAEILQHPGFGNYVDHQMLFSEPVVRRAATAVRLWRINAYAFRETVNSLSQRRILQIQENQGGDGLHPALPFLAPEHSFRDNAALHGFEDATTELLLDMMWQVAGYQIDARKGPAEFQTVLRKQRPGADDYAAAIGAQFDLVLQRQPSSDEQQRLVELARVTADSADVKTALQTVLAAVLLTPESVFRLEVGSQTPDEHGRVRLTNREIAQAVAYALTDRPPDALLRRAAEQGTLSTTAGVLDQVNRILHDDAIDKPRILRFFQEYFEYTRAPNVFKTGRLIKHFMPEQMVLDADALVLRILAEDRNVLKELLTTNRYFVNYKLPGRQSVNRPDRRQQWYYELFNLPRLWEWQEDQPIAFPQDQRAGMLTHPAWLLSFSDSDHNQAIQRGRWVQMKLLGGTVPDIPISVEAQLPDDETLTLRQRMQVTRQEYCWRCHQKMDDLGLPFEHFDHFGQFRTTELEHPVDASGRIDVGIAEVDAAVADPFAMVHRLAESRHVQQVFVRHAFRYWMGRNETLDDAPTLIDAEHAYHDHQGSMRALIASLLTSDSFLYRRVSTMDSALDLGRVQK